MSISQLPREPIRPDLDDEIDRELWQPSWICFCCHDAGLIQQTLVDMVIPDYDAKRDKPVACQYPRCKEGWNFRGSEAYDQRFDAATCIELDKLNRASWHQFVIEQFEGAKQRKAADEIAKAAKEKSMSQKQRTANDDREVEIRQYEFEKTDSERAAVREEALRLLQDG